MGRFFKFSGSGTKLRADNKNSPAPFSMFFKIGKGSTDPRVGSPARVYLDSNGTKPSTGFVKVVGGVIPDVWLLCSYGNQTYIYDASCTVPGGQSHDWAGQVRYADSSEIFAPKVNPRFDGTPRVPDCADSPDPDYVEASGPASVDDEANASATAVVGEVIENVAYTAANAASAIRIIAQQPWVPTDSPTFHSPVIVPTPTLDDSSNTIASTAFVTGIFGKASADRGVAAIFNASLTGAPTAPDITEDSPSGQVLNAASMVKIIEALKPDLAGVSPITGNPTYTADGSPDPEQPVTALGLKTLVEGGLDYVPVKSPNFYGTPKAQLAPDAPAGDQMTTAAWAKAQVAKSTPKPGKPELSPAGIGQWESTSAFVIKKIPDASDDSMILYAVQWDVAPSPAPMVGRRVRVSCKSKADVYATIGFVYDDIGGKPAWLLVTDTPVLGFDLTEEATSIGMHPLLTARVITQNFYNWQNTFFRGIPTLAKSPAAESYSAEIATTEFVSAAMKLASNNSLASRKITGLNIQYQPFDWINGETHKKVKFAKNASLMLTPGSCRVNGQVYIKSDYSKVDIHADVIKSAVSGDYPNPWLFVYVATFNSGGPEVVVVDSQSVGEKAHNLFEMINTYALNKTGAVAAKILACFPANRAVSQIDDEYVYRSNYSDISAKSSGWNVDGVYVDKKIINSKDHAYYTAEFGLDVTSPVKYLPQYSQVGTFSITGEISGLYGPILCGMGEKWDSGISQQTRLSQSIVADAASIPNLLVEPYEMSRVADITDPERVVNLQSYGPMRMVRGSLMATPVPLGYKGSGSIHEIIKALFKRWYGQESGFRVANGFDNLPVGPSNKIRLSIDALIGNDATPKGVVFLNVVVIPHGHKYNRGQVADIIKSQATEENKMKGESGDNLAAA